jgi:hypothetical protein
MERSRFSLMVCSVIAYLFEQKKCAIASIFLDTENKQNYTFVSCNFTVVASMSNR